jgi:hypothetical protein
MMQTTHNMTALVQSVNWWQLLPPLQGPPAGAIIAVWFMQHESRQPVMAKDLTKTV